MPFTWQININKSASGAGYVYAPSSLTGVAIADEVCFTNNDDNPHWPALVSTSAVAGNPATYFMANQIAPHSSSTSWVPGVNGTVTYADSLDKSATKPTGTIVVANPTAAPSATIASKEQS
jgi:plastocyanin